MASFAAACRMSARLAARKVQRDAAARGFRTSAAALAAQNFTMPALSPTMTEGNIAAWRVKEGEKFSAGDVLLEIETDKATMDVEAQEDGFLMKVMQGDGSKGVQVGTRIAVIAEEGDDISSLQIPADESTKAAEAPKTQTPATPVPESAQPASAPPKAATKPGAKTSKQTYPLYPSVAHLLKVNGLDESAVSSITATGPNGRLLKGDVLAFLGQINANTPSVISARFEKASHLDLSDIKVAKAPAPKKKEAAAAPPPAPVKSVVTLPVSLSAVIETQRKIEKSVGVFLPLSTFISRATELANDELPLPVGHQPTTDELFNQILGLDKVAGPKVSRGSYIPQIGALVPAFPPRAAPAKEVDILDILTAPSTPQQVVKKTTVLPGASTGPNVFSLQVPKAEERRAHVFLERVKLVLETEPGRLVL
ncbi:pyruvate dehydrogenase complex protein X component, mitochondrial [Chaetomidium leptoderma]|uniref:Pyruvate dehydrogenase complex protein X component, mitochondrial n=1 Tax=Chaetomidium leptoderma TaxID=669021 RepID=A0AAN6VWB1_9PEZI|nr:pyruvate dehydrogenase complex protein X component, mitochondrial [Chaetomidium leptoderma]